MTRVDLLAAAGLIAALGTGILAGYAHAADPIRRVIIEDAQQRVRDAVHDLGRLSPNDPAYRDALRDLVRAQKLRNAVEGRRP